MQPVNFDESNCVFGKPSNMTDEQCAALPTWKGNVPFGDGSVTPVIISKWQPSKEDIENINNGEGVYLYIYGEGMPPVALVTENPFK
jgi:hypothetical protein